jgi:hypothetical protein
VSLDSTKSRLEGILCCFRFCRSRLSNQLPFQRDLSDTHRIVSSLKAIFRTLSHAGAHDVVEHRGADGWMVLIGSGSFSRMALATLSCDLPSKARLPVLIS